MSAQDKKNHTHNVIIIYCNKIEMILHLLKLHVVGTFFPKFNAILSAA